MTELPLESDLRSMLDEGQTLYQISRHFNTNIPEIFKLGRSYGISFSFYHNNIPKPIKQDLESMYNDEEMTQEQIAKEFNVTRCTVGTWLRNYNISTVGHQGVFVPIPPKEVLERMYTDEGMTQEEIGEEFGVHQGTVGEWLRYYNISTVGRMGAPINGSQVPIPPKEVLERMYTDEGMTQYQIGKKFNVHEGTVGEWLRYYNISTVGRMGAPINGSQVPIPPKEVLERMYTDEGMTQEEIAKEFNVTHRTVSNWLRYYNIPTRGSTGTLAVPMPPKDDLLKCIADGLNQHQIAENWNVSDATIFRWCEYYGIPGMVMGFRHTAPEYQEWRYAVFDRDHRTCQKCGATNTPMQAHHIVPYCDHPELEYELENGITLCEGCHKSIRGYEYDYIDQFAAITQPRGKYNGN